MANRKLPPAESKRQTRNPDKTRRRLLVAATRLFSRRGYDGVSVDDIVLAARVNKRMVYHYFGNKDGLYAEVLRSVFQRLSELEFQAFDTSEAPEQVIANIMRSYFHFLADNPEFVALLSWENLHEGRFVKKHPEILSKNPVLEKLGAAISAGIAARIFRPGIDIRHLLINLISLCFIYHANRFTLSHSIGLDLQSPEVLQDGLQHSTELVIRGLRPETHPIKGH